MSKVTNGMRKKRKYICVIKTGNGNAAMCAAALYSTLHYLFSYLQNEVPLLFIALTLCQTMYTMKEQLWWQTYIVLATDLILGIKLSGWVGWLRRLCRVGLQLEYLKIVLPGGWLVGQAMWDGWMDNLKKKNKPASWGLAELGNKLIRFGGLVLLTIWGWVGGQITWK
jgi:hypothetical protein